MKQFFYILFGFALALCSCRREPEVAIKVDSCEVEVYAPEKGAKEADFRCKLTSEKQPDAVLWLDFRYLSESSRLQEGQFDITGTFSKNDMIPDGCKYTADGQNYVYFHECTISIEQGKDGRYRLKGNARGENGTTYTLNSIIKEIRFTLPQNADIEKADYSGEPDDQTSFDLIGADCIVNPYGDYYQCGINNYLVVIPATDGSFLYIDLMGTSDLSTPNQLVEGTYKVGSFKTYVAMTLNHGDATALAKYDMTTYYLANEITGVKYWITDGEMVIEAISEDNYAISAHLTTANHSSIQLSYSGSVSIVE